MNNSGNAGNIDDTNRNLLVAIVSVLPFLNHFTSIGWSPVTLHCSVAVSPSLVDTVLVVEENIGEAVGRQEVVYVSLTQ